MIAAVRSTWGALVTAALTALMLTVGIAAYESSSAVVAYRWTARTDVAMVWHTLPTGLTAWLPCIGVGAFAFCVAWPLAIRCTLRNGRNAEARSNAVTHVQH